MQCRHLLFSTMHELARSTQLVKSSSQRSIENILDKPDKLCYHRFGLLTKPRPWRILWKFATLILSATYIWLLMPCFGSPIGFIWSIFFACHVASEPPLSVYSQVTFNPKLYEGSVWMWDSCFPPWSGSSLRLWAMWARSRKKSFEIPPNIHGMRTSKIIFPVLFFPFVGYLVGRYPLQQWLSSGKVQRPISHVAHEQFLV